ncbi:MAG: hypothetical protein IKK64_00470 [Bacteroidales bacterium]|nr:hypothetical protein [Bacteroidales bacterium]
MFIFLLLALWWFKKGKKELSIITFFGFLTGGFQLIPDAVFAFPVSIKPTDYAILYLLGVIAMEYFSGKRKELIDVLPKFTLIFLSFIVLAAGVSIFIYHIPIVEVIKNTRQYFLLLSPILFYTLSKEELQNVVKFLFKITLFLSILYSLQPMLDMPILQGHYTEGKTPLFGMFEIARFYNTPIYHNFFFLFALYNSEFTKKQKLVYLSILVLPIFLCMHRSLLLAFILVVLYNHFREKIKKIYPILIVIFVALIPFLGVIQGNLLETKIAQDIIGSVEIEPEDFVAGTLDDATFTFRVLHFLERLYYASEDWITLLFGLGFMSEGSDYTINNFDFIVGLENEETGFVDQVNTADIAWSLFVIRLGLIGTIVYLIYYFLLMRFFNKRYNKPIAKSIFLAMCLIFILTFTGVRILDMETITFILLVYVLLQKNEINVNNEEDNLLSKENN